MVENIKQDGGITEILIYYANKSSSSYSNTVFVFVFVLFSFDMDVLFYPFCAFSLSLKTSNNNNNNYVNRIIINKIEMSLYIQQEKNVITMYIYLLTYTTKPLYFTMYNE